MHRHTNNSEYAANDIHINLRFGYGNFTNSTHKHNTVLSFSLFASVDSGVFFLCMSDGFFFEVVHAIHDNHAFILKYSQCKNYL